MTPEQEYYYANDFGGRFRNEIHADQGTLHRPALAAPSSGGRGVREGIRAMKL